MVSCYCTRISKTCWYLVNPHIYSKRTKRYAIFVYPVESFGTFVFQLNIFISLTMKAAYSCTRWWTVLGWSTSHTASPYAHPPQSVSPLSQLHSCHSQLVRIYSGRILPSDDASSAISMSSASSAWVVAIPSCWNISEHLWYNSNAKISVQFMVLTFSSILSTA